MKKINLLGAAVLMLASFTACNQPAPQADLNPVLTIAGGQVIGALNEDSTVLMYKGVPFAAPPVGDLRWKKPQPVQPWDTIMVADHFRNASWQAAHNPNDGNYGVEFFPEDAPFSEDCLHANIWTPQYAAGNPDAKLPVAMWIHGGAYNAGWSFEMEMDGEAFAQRDVILVTVNYRLGIFGFLNHPELSAEDNGHSGNYGTYDQVAALQWIHDNIAAFGGDPENITVFGQSAGAASVKNVVISPLSKGMVKRAIIQSGGGLRGIPEEPTPQEELDAKSKKTLDEAGFDTLEKMRAASWTELMDKLPSGWGNPNALSFTPHTDGVLLTQDFSTAAMTNTLADVPYMLGHTANDMSLLANGEERFAEVRDSLSTHPTFIYFFNRPLPTDGRPSLQGAFHSSELWYVFHTLNRSWRPFTEADYALSDEMVDAWTNFCKNGDPNGGSVGTWTAYTKDTPFIYEFKIKE